MSAYDPVATLYDRAFADIRVRRAEWRWLRQRLDGLATPHPRVLEIGCGTGAVLRAIAPHISIGLGVDISREMLTRARAGSAGIEHLSFAPIAGPELPVASRSMDVVLSFLSFRYLDWNQIWPEIRRVLAPQGRFLMIDMAAAAPRLENLPALVRSTLRTLLLPVRTPGFARDLEALTRHPDWRAMLARHPARPLSEYATFFAHQLPGRPFELLDVGRHRQIIAIDSGELS